jgi:release factor glutamine methyltransferase
MSEMPEWTVLQILQTGTAFLTKKEIANARLNAEQLLCHTLGSSRIELYLTHDRPLTPDEVARYRAVLRRRAQHVPLQYILGETELMSLPFKVNPDVLIPRPETEILIEAVLEKCRHGSAGAKTHAILDIGTGSGCISVCLAVYLPFSQIVAIDVSTKALAIAADNARHNGVDGKIIFQYKNILNDASFGCPFDLVVANPPYVSALAYAQLPVEVKDHEPALALQGGADGLTFFRRLAEIAHILLKKGGTLMVEVGDGQAGAVQACFKKANLTNVSVYADLNGTERVVSIEF